MVNAYWKNRIEEEQLARMQRGASLSDEMARLYDYHFKELEKEIRAFEQRYADKNGIPPSTIKSRVDEMDVKAFEEKAKRYVMEKDFSDKANAELALYNLKMKINRLELLQYQLDLEVVALSNSEHKLTEKFLSQSYVRELKLQSGLLGRSTPSAKEVEHVARATMAAPFHGAVWSDVIWKRQRTLRGIVAQMTEDLLLKGINPTTMIPRLKKEFGVSTYEAKRLAVTEGARMATEAQRQSFAANGYEEYEYIAEVGACPLCKSLDGKIFKVADMLPGTNAAPMHPHCHCSTAAHNFMRDEKYKPSLREYRQGKENIDILDRTDEKSYNQSTNSSGAVYGALNNRNDPDETKRRAHAEQYYNSVRNRSTKNEIYRISTNTGFSNSEIEIIYNHIFENYYPLEGGMKRFDPDYDTAQSWERLFSGKNIQPHDLTLLRHELLEGKLMAEGLDYDTAHKITQKEHDYLADLIKWQMERGDL